MCLSKELLFSWLPSPYSIDGYRIYIGSRSSDYYRFVDVGRPDPINGRIQYKISVQGGAKFYTCTAYKGDNESDFSNEVTVSWMPIPELSEIQEL